MALGVVVALCAGWIIWDRKRAQAALHEYEKEFVAAGGKLNFSELLSPMPEGENKAMEFIGLCATIRTGAVLTLHAPPALRCVAPGKGMVITKEPEWFDKAAKKSFRWEQVGEDLELNRETLDELRAVLRSPVLRYALHYRGSSTLLPHIGPTRKAAQWFSSSGLYNVHAGNIKAAVDDIEAVLLAGRVLEHEPVLISQLVRAANVSIGVHAAWPLLQHDNLPDAELARLQALFSNPNLSGPMISALQGEQVMGRDTIHRLRSEELDFSEIIDLARSFGSEDETPRALEKMPYGSEIQGAIRAGVIYPMWRYSFSYDDERHLLEEVQDMIDATREARTNNSAALLQRAMNEHKRRFGPGSKVHSWRYFATRMLASAVEKCSIRAFQAEAQCQLAMTATALKRYQLRHGKLPGDLAGLVPEFLPKVPVDIMGGSPLRYRVDGTNFVLWSVGTDFKDDGGKPDTTEPFGWVLAPDLVWPQPASPAEVTKYNESLRSKR